MSSEQAGRTEEAIAHYQRAGEQATQWVRFANVDDAAGEGVTVDGTEDPYDFNHEMLT
jgi:hypothetical protein